MRIGPPASKPNGETPSQLATKIPYNGTKLSGGACVTSTLDLKRTLSFLNALARNNNRPWFEQNRPAYEAARSAFEALVDELIIRLGDLEDMRGVTARDCIMRIYRDIRFSKDKSPYKTWMSASIGPGGRKSYRFHFYLHLQPRDQSMLAGGLHEPESAQLARFRAAIDRDPRKFKSLVGSRSFKRYFGEVRGERLKTAPQGYDRDHPEIDLLRLKGATAVHSLTDAQVLAPGFPSHAVKVCTAMKPFLDYLSSVTL
jgi:uncharacterized protein (TIGR02453 family)